MAEAAAALGIAAAAVQFFDFSLKALSLCKEIRDSERGASKANQELEECSGKLKQVYEDLKVNTRLQVADRPITKARQDCMAVVDELLKLLNDVKSKSRDKNFAAVKAAFRVLKNKRGIEVLHNKLSQAQTRFLSAVSVETKNDVALLLEKQDKLSDTIQKAVLPELLKAHTASAAGHKKTQDELANLAAASSLSNNKTHDLLQKKVLPELLEAHTASVAGHKKTQDQIDDVAAAASVSHIKTHDLLQDVQKSQQSSLKVARSTGVAMSKGVMTIEAQSNTMITNAQAATRRKEVMDSLWYPEMFERQQSIKPPSFKSFEWIFDDSPVSEDNIKAGWDQPQETLREEMRGKFARWLRNDEPLFWISGKAGSGKSSLMSLIQSDPRTDIALSGWASERRLFKFSFYFWRAGSPLQKTVRGLIRSLLYQLARANPIVIDHLMATHSRLDSDWTTASLLAAFRKGLSAFQGDRIFLMVDGLDEYEDDYDDLLNLILEYQQEGCLKVCIASRPETQILNRLSTYPFLRLQNLNYKDIELFVEGRLKPYEHRISKDIRESLIWRAEGVFLWAVLVSDHLKRGALAGDDTETLRRRLYSTPGELNQLFKQLLDEIDEEHIQTLKLCLFYLAEWLWHDHCLTAPGSVELITACMPNCKDVKNSMGFVELCVRASEELIAQGKGMLELEPDHMSPQYQSYASHWTFDVGQNKFVPIDRDKMILCKSRVKFVHRSAHDFVFGIEKIDGEHNQWRLTKEDVDRSFLQTLRGTETLLRCAPLLIIDHTIVFEHIGFEMGLILSFLRGTKWNRNSIFEWLDRVYGLISWRYPTQRELQLSKAASVSWCSEINLAHIWHAENQFWNSAVFFDDYLESRWEKLIGHPNVRAICSSIIATYRDFGVPEPSIERCRRTLLAEVDMQSAPAMTRHIRDSRIWYDYPIWSLSWEATGRPGEQYIMAMMLVRLEWQHTHKSSELGGFESVRNQVAFASLVDLHTMPLNIQILVHPERVWQSSFGSCELLGQYTTQIRLLSSTPQDKDRTSRIPYTGSEMYEDLVGGLCDVHLDLSGAAMNQPFSEREAASHNEWRFPSFTGTNDQFSDCLEQVKSQVRANRKQQLSAPQQLHMLALVEKYFQEYWTIVTLETLELSNFTLEYRSEEEAMGLGLLGDLKNAYIIDHTNDRTERMNQRWRICRSSG